MKTAIKVSELELAAWRFPAGENTVTMLVEGPKEIAPEDIDAVIETLVLIRTQIVRAEAESTFKELDGRLPCDTCGGSGTDGFDRSYPPNPYVCDNCDGTGKEPEVKKIRCQKCNQVTPDGKCALCDTFEEPHAPAR